MAKVLPFKQANSAKIPLPGTPGLDIISDLLAEYSADEIKDQLDMIADYDATDELGGVVINKEDEE